MLEKINNPFDNNVYKVSLFTIKENQTAYIDLSKAQNISLMSCEPIVEIFVKTTLSPNYVKEIITSMLIPIRIDECVHEWKYEDYILYLIYSNSLKNLNKINNTTFIRKGKIIEIWDDSIFFSTNAKYLFPNFTIKRLCIPSSKELINYIEQHKNKEQYLNELKEIFITSEKRYQEALSKNEIYNKYHTKKLLKKLKN